LGDMAHWMYSRIYYGNSDNIFSINSIGRSKMTNTIAVMDVLYKIGWMPIHLLIGMIIGFLISKYHKNNQ